MSFIEHLAWAVLALLGLYLAARIVFAAYFRSKQDHDERNNHGPQTKP